MAAPLRMRSRAELPPLFGRFGLIEPGLMPVPLWRPEPGDQDAAGTSRFWGGLAGGGPEVLNYPRPAVTGGETCLVRASRNAVR